MVTLAANSPRAFEMGDRNEAPVIAADIIYEGAAVGIVPASGHMRPLAAGDIFAGFAEDQTDNSLGAAAALNQRTIGAGKVRLSISGAVITDVGQPVYATDDDTFVFSPVGAVFVGFAYRFDSSGIMIVDFNAANYQDPYAAYGSPEFYELKSANYTLDIQDNGKVIFVDTDAVVITIPAVATPVNVAIVNIGAYGTVTVNVSPAAADGIHAPDIAYVDNKDHINTKATAQRGDLVVLSTSAGDANGSAVLNQIGTWAQQA